MRPTDSERWLPVTFTFDTNAVSVRWIRFGDERPLEPFFHQTVKKLLLSAEPAPQRTTTLTAFIDAARQLPTIQPAGVIFHVSRCGSTLLANALRTSEQVVLLSEARPFGTFFRPAVFKNSPFPTDGWESARKMLLDHLSTIYAHSVAARDPKLVLKCHAASLLQIQLVRSVWPDVPFVVVVRDPVAVMMSNMAKPAGWIRARRRRSLAALMFGWSPAEVEQMSLEDYCARGLGQFCESAAKMVGDKCRVIDYENLDARRIRDVADFFGITLPPDGSPILAKVLGTYAKDAAGARPFESDSERKRRDATEAVKQAAARWAYSSYLSLRVGERSAGDEREFVRRAVDVPSRARH